MSKIALTPNASGTGIFTVASPNSSTDRTLTLPDETGTVDTLQRSGNVIQVVNFQTGAAATGTTTIPLDNTIPQITEGNEYMTLAITPTNASNILIIHVGVAVSHTATNHIIAALFQDATAGALASRAEMNSTAITNKSCTFTYKMVAGTTSATTFRIRIGSDVPGTTTFNVAVQGGIVASSITITEIAV